MKICGWDLKVVGGRLQLLFRIVHRDFQSIFILWSLSYTDISKLVLTIHLEQQYSCGIINKLFNWIEGAPYLLKAFKLRNLKDETNPYLVSWLGREPARWDMRVLLPTPCRPIHPITTKSVWSTRNSRQVSTDWNWSSISFNGAFISAGSARAFVSRKHAKKSRPSV